MEQVQKVYTRVTGGVCSLDLGLEIRAALFFLSFYLFTRRLGWVGGRYIGGLRRYRRRGVGGVDTRG